MLAHGGVYLAGAVGGAMVALLTIPILTRALSGAEYGQYALFQAAVPLLVVPMSLNLHSALSRYCLEEDADVPGFVGTTILVTLLAAFLTVPTLWVARAVIAEVLYIQRDLIGYVLICAVCTAIFSINSQFFVGHRLSRSYAGWQFLSKFVPIGVGLAGLLVSRSVHTVVAGMSIGWIIVAGLCLRRLVPIADWRFDPRHARYIARFSLPMIPYILGGVVMDQIGRVLVARYVGVEEAGVYNVAASIAAMALLILSSIQLSSYHDQMRLLSSKSFDEFQHFMLRAYSFQAIAIAGIMLFGKDLLLVLTDAEYHRAGDVLITLVLGYLFLAIFYVHSAIFGFRKLTYWYSVLIALCAFLCVLIGSHLVPIYGIVGAALASTISYAVYAASAFLVGRWVLRSRQVANWRILVLTLPVIVAFGVGLLWSPEDVLTKQWMLNVGARGGVFVGLLGLQWGLFQSGVCAPESSHA